MMVAARSIRRVFRIPSHSDCFTDRTRPITFTPNHFFCMVPIFHQFLLLIADGNGGVERRQPDGLVTVLSNDQPVVSPDVLTVDEDTGATLVDVLANDTDVI